MQPLSNGRAQNSVERAGDFCVHLWPSVVCPPTTVNRKL